MPREDELLELAREILKANLRRTQPLVYAYAVAALYSQLPKARSRRKFAEAIGESPSQVTEALQIADAFPVCDLLGGGVDMATAATLPHSVLRALVNRVPSTKRISALRHVVGDAKDGVAPTVSLREYLERDTPPPPPFVCEVADDGTLTLRVNTPLDQMSSAEMFDLETQLGVKLEPWRDELRRRLGRKSLQDELLETIKKELGGWGGYLAVQIKESAQPAGQTSIEEFISPLHKEVELVRSLLYEHYNDNRVIKEQLAQAAKHLEASQGVSDSYDDDDIPKWLERALNEHFERLRTELRSTKPRRKAQARPQRSKPQKAGAMKRVLTAIWRRT